MNLYNVYKAWEMYVGDDVSCNHFLLQLKSSFTLQKKKKKKKRDAFTLAYEAWNLRKLAEKITEQNPTMLLYKILNWKNSYSVSLFKDNVYENPL